jgi:hypothetical protein
VLIADKQGIEPGAACRRGSLDHPARSLARIYHVRVIARERDPDSHSVIPSPAQTCEKRRDRYFDQHAGLGVTLAGAFRDNRRNGLVCEIRGDAVRLEPERN